MPGKCRIYTQTMNGGYAYRRELLHLRALNWFIQDYLNGNTNGNDLPTNIQTVETVPWANSSLLYALIDYIAFYEKGDFRAEKDRFMRLVTKDVNSIIKSVPEVFPKDGVAKYLQKILSETSN